MYAYNYHQNYSRSPHPRPLPPKKKRHWLALVPALALSVLIILVLQHLIFAKHALGHEVKAKVVKPLTSAQLAKLSNNINQIINNNQDIDIAVSVIDLKTSAHQNYGLQDPFEAASTGKLITATDFLHHVEQGSDSLNETINGDTAKYELQQMIVISDNDAWQTFNDLLGHDDLESYASSLGITNYSADYNTLTADDIAILLQKLYTNQLLNKSDTQLLLGYMAKANENNYIGPAAPSDAKFYHKAGILDDRVHDAAIIDNGKRPIVLVIFTREDGDEDYTNRAQIIQQITAQVLRSYSIN